MDGKQLKNSILQWAIQGKLVPQNPKDEPAQKLLEKIALSRHSERSEESSKRSKKASTSLRGAKATKQSKALSSRIYRENGVWYEQVGTATPKDISDEIPFEIPETWAWCRLDNLGTFVRGNGIKRDETVSTGKPCVRYGEMYTTYRVKFSDIKSHTTSNIFDKCQKFHKDDILMALTGENKWDIALAAVYQGDQEVALGGDMCKFSPFESNSLYLVYLINSPYGIGYKRETSTGDIIVHTSVGKLGNFLIPLPPLAEQKRIVAKLEQVLPLAEEYGAAQEQLDKLNKELPEVLKKSILQEAIQGKLVPQNPKDEPAQKLLERIERERNAKIKSGEIKLTKPEKNIKKSSPEYDIPQGWCWCQLVNICRAFGRIGFRGYTKEDLVTDSTKGALSLSPSNMKDHGMEYNVCTYISWEKYEESPEIKIENGDLLIVKTGSSYGKAVIVENLPCKATINPQIAVIKDVCIEKKYLLYFLQSPFAREKYEDFVLGTSIPTFSQANLLSIGIPLPPLAEQKRIVKKIEELHKVIDSWH